MENTLAQTLGINKERKDVLYEQLHTIYAANQGLEPEIIKGIIEFTSNPLEIGLMTFEAGRVITEMNCPIHQMGGMMNRMVGPIEIPKGVDPMDFINSMMGGMGKKRKQGKPFETKGEA